MTSRTLPYIPLLLHIQHEDNAASQPTITCQAGEAKHTLIHAETSPSNADIITVCSSTSSPLHLHITLLLFPNYRINGINAFISSLKHLQVACHWLFGWTVSQRHILVGTTAWYTLDVHIYANPTLPTTSAFIAGQREVLRYLPLYVQRLFGSREREEVLKQVVQIMFGIAKQAQAEGAKIEESKGSKIEGPYDNTFTFKHSIGEILSVLQSDNTNDATSTSASSFPPSSTNPPLPTTTSSASSSSSTHSLPPFPLPRSLLSCLALLKKSCAYIHEIRIVRSAHQSSKGAAVRMQMEGGEVGAVCAFLQQKNTSATESSNIYSTDRQNIVEGCTKVWGELVHRFHSLATS